MEILSKKLKELRKNKSVIQKVVAQNIGISERQYIDLENGKCMPSVDTLIKLADFYGMTTDFLLGRGTPTSTTSQSATVEGVS